MSSKTYSKIAIAILIVGELIGAVMQQFGCHWWYGPIIISLALCLLLIAIAWFHIRMHPNCSILANLVSSTISPSWLGLTFLVIFISHLTWWMDVVIEFFKPVSNERDLWCLLFVMSTLGLIATAWFFPEGRLAAKEVKDRVVFFSGISLVPSGANERKTEYGKFNIIPIVRMLQTVFYENGIFKGKPCKLVILCSDAKQNMSVGDEGYKYPVLNGNYSPNPVGSSNQWKKEAIHLSTKKKPDEKTLKRERCLRNIIKDAALIEFPDKKDEIEELEICFTESCDYDIFEECYAILDKAVKNEDNSNTQLCFNLTPGTGIVGSLMTLFSIDADRRLFYYAQFTTDYDCNTERVQEADKAKIPLESLLSQALQKMHPRK